MEERLKGLQARYLRQLAGSQRNILLTIMRERIPKLQKYAHCYIKTLEDRSAYAEKNYHGPNLKWIGSPCSDQDRKRKIVHR